MAKKVEKKTNQVETTGHEWDGIEELNNPLPRWWLWSWVASIIFSIGYCVVYPSWPVPGGFLKGTMGWSQYQELADAKAVAAEGQANFNARIHNSTPQEILNNPELSAFAFEAGKAEFALSCSQCHGSGAQGLKGYPSLLDDEWIWGGKFEDIVYTITHGVRTYEDEDTRDSEMAAYGKDEILEKQEIADVARYIEVISEDFSENDSSDRGAEIFADNCTACHGENGEGDHEFGAPALNNGIWLYGGHTTDLIETITNGRKGQMPAFGLKLSEDQIKKLAIYVYSLTGGEKVE